MRYVLQPLVVILALSLAAWATAAAGPSTTVQDVAEGLTCQCGCGLTVANCNHPNCGFSVPMRGEIAGMIRKGMSRIEILDAFRHKYGEKILSAPTTQGFNLLAWIIPYVAVGAGFLLILIAVARWQKPDATEAGSERQARGSAVSQFDPGLRQQLERDLKRQL
jgi:cytochrome c-type biogenesis protein CcmH